MSDESKWTPEPWSLLVYSGGSCQIVDANERTVAHAVPLHNAERAVACVNACAGIADPSAVPELVDIARTLSMRGHADACEARLNERHHPCSCLCGPARALLARVDGGAS